jgi:hypothetical protein
MKSNDLMAVNRATGLARRSFERRMPSQPSPAKLRLLRSLVYKVQIPLEASMRPHILVTLLLTLIMLPAAGRAQSAASERAFVVEYYYKAKWGHAGEFLKLFKKNHYPVLKKEMELGRISKVWMDQPRYHTTEDGRWDFRVTIVFKNATVANEPFDEAALQKQLYPDQDTFQKEEQRRFEILDAHWDLPIKTVDLDAN